MIAHAPLRELRNIRLGKDDAQLVIDRLNDDFGVENRLQVGDSQRFPKSVILIKMQIFEMDFPEPADGQFVWEQQYDRVLYSRRPPIYDAPRRRTRSQENGSATTDTELPKDSALPFTFCSMDSSV